MASSQPQPSRQKSLPASGSAPAGVAGSAVGVAAGGATPASATSSGRVTAARQIAQPGSSTNVSVSSPNRSSPASTAHRSARSRSSEPETVTVAQSLLSLLDEVYMIRARTSTHRGQRASPVTGTPSPRLEPTLTSAPDDRSSRQP